MKKILALVLAMIMVLGMVACAPAEESGEKLPVDTYVDPYAALEGDDKYAAIYEDVLGEFAKLYADAKKATSLSERWALMAAAEGKLMGAALMLPLSSNGGNYAISRVAPYTAPNTLWGNDNYRYHNVVVATEPITVTHRNEMKAKYNELKGTGTYEAWAKSYLNEKGYVIKDSYTFLYNSDPKTWDVLSTAKAADSEAIINTYDGLYEYDCEGRLMPALALSHTVTDNADGTQTWTFTLRTGAKWVDSQGRAYGTVTADDFVAGMQHMLDTGSQLGYLAYEAAQIVGSGAYYAKETTDFSTVGVKAIDEHTVAYTLAAPCTFFDTMVGYGCFAPLNRAYYESKGGKFGADYDKTAEGYTYGKTPDDIAYCGPYIVTANNAENSIEFSANENYWNADNINIKTITWKYTDGKDTLKGYNDTMSGAIDGAGLNSSSAQKAKDDGKFDTLAYISACDATSFMGFYNINRAAYANFNDETAAISPKTDAQKARTNAAMKNVHFRRALSMALDRATYNAQIVGDELKLTSLRNSYTPGNFVQLAEDVTIKINGTDTQFKAGTYYGAIMQAQIDADGVKIKVWDPAAEEGAGSTDGFDGWYNVQNAVAELNTAIAELEAAGLHIAANNPIYIDLPTFEAREEYKNRSAVYKKSIEEALGGKVIVNLVSCADADQWYGAGYDAGSGAEMNYDIYDLSGWGPDYGDPQTYLDTFLSDYSGYMCMMLGIY